LKICSFNTAFRGVSTLSLEEFQHLVLSHGAQSLDPGNKNPLFYVKTLFLILCHEEALKHLANFETFQIELVHFMIVIRESGLAEEDGIAVKIIN
jgi:Nup93/Nic96